MNASQEKHFLGGKSYGPGTGGRDTIRDTEAVPSREMSVKGYLWGVYNIIRNAKPEAQWRH